MVEYLFAGKSLDVQKNLEFFTVNKSVTADGSLPSPTGGVSGIHHAPDIHEHFMIYNRLRNIVYTMRSSEHAAHRLLMHSVHTSHLWLKVSPCVSFHVIHACALVCCLLSGLSSPVFLLPRPVPLPALPDVHPGA